MRLRCNLYIFHVFYALLVCAVSSYTCKLNMFMCVNTTISIADVLDEDTYVEGAQTPVNTTHIPAQEQTMAATNQQEEESTNT